MAATTTRQSGVSFVVEEGGTNIGGSTQATLTANVDMIDTTNTGSSSWMTTLAGVRDWSIAFEAMYLESTSEISGSGATLDIDGYDLPGLKTFTANFSRTQIDITDEDSSLDREYLLGTRSMSVDFEGNWFEPQATGNNAVVTLIDAANGDATNSMTLTLTFGSGQSISCTARIDSFEISAPYDDVVAFSGTLASTGTVTITDTNADASWAALVTDWETAVPTAPTVTFSNNVTDDTQFAGTGLFSDFSITVPHDGAVTASGTIIGTGALSDSVIT